jgi:hypothetical protein
MAKKVLFSCVGLALLGIGVGIGRVSGPKVSGDGDSPSDSNTGGSFRTLMAGGRGPNKKDKGKAGVKESPQGADASKILDVFNVPNGSLATAGLYSALQKMSGDQISEMLVGVKAVPNHARRREVRERLVDYLTMTDPVKALELRDTIVGEGILDKSFKQLGRNGLASAAALIEQLEDQGLRMKTAEHCRSYCRHPLLGSGADRIISFPRKAGRFTVMEDPRLTHEDC